MEHHNNTPAHPERHVEREPAGTGLCTGLEDWQIRRTADKGIATARAEGTEVSADQARTIASGLARLLDAPNSKLDAFARTGEGDYLELREEYLDLYANPATPGYAKEWVDWLGTYLVHRDTTGEEASDGTR